MTKGEQAEALFHEGYNCSQSVACAFADELGLSIDTVAMMMSGFGGGFGRLREVCGTVSGMTFVLSTLHGYANPDATDTKTQTYAMIQKAANTFKEKTGSIICRELLGLDAPEGVAQAQPRTAEYYAQRPCSELCHIAGDIVAEMLADFHNT